MPIGEKSLFRLKVDLKPESAEVHVSVIERATDSVVESGVFSARELPENIRPTVELYGLSKLLQDRTSETESGPSKLAAMNEVMDMFRAGQYERERRAGAPVVSAEVEALAEIKGHTVAQVQAALRKFTKEQREKIFSHPKVVERAAAIRKGREDADVDFSKELGV